MSRTSLLLRSLFLLGFVLVMPLLALPGVARWADELLYGKQPGHAVADSTQPDDDLAISPEREVVRAVLETPLPKSKDVSKGAGADRGLDSITPPPLAPTPEFPHPNDQGADSESPPLDLSFDQSSFPSNQAQQSGPSRDQSSGDSGPQRLDRIRQRLADLGADYIVVTAVQGTSQYHCQCRMLVAAGSEETESFEARGKDPAVVAEQVLQAVQAWRATQASRSP